MAQVEQDTPTEEEPGSEILFGAGQSAWLAVVTVVAFLALVLGVVALVVAGTSDDGGGGGTAATLPPPSAEQTSVLVDFAFEPPDYVVPAGEEVVVTLQNEGNTEHNYTILNAGVNIDSDAQFNEGLVLEASDDVAVGETSEFAFQISDPGTYEIVCTIPGHLDQGMKGSLIVQ